MTNNSKLMNKLRLSMIINFTLTVMFLVILGLYVSDHNTNIKIQDTLSTENEILINKVATIATEKDEFYKDVREDNIVLSSNGAILCYMVDVLSEQNKQLMNQSNRKSEELEIFNARDELYDKYDYAIIRDDGTRTDLTYDQLLLLEDLCENSIVNDPDLFLAWIMTESKGVEDAKNNTSSARGYGQFINSTSKWVYEDLCDKQPTWTSAVALDGNTNIEMMVKYVEYLYDKYDGDIDKVIDSYRGAHSDVYVATINSYLSTKGKSVDSISEDLKTELED